MRCGILSRRTWEHDAPFRRSLQGIFGKAVAVRRQSPPVAPAAAIGALRRAAFATARVGRRSSTTTFVLVSIEITAHPI